MAQLKNTNISDTGSLDLPVGTTAQRPGSPQQGMIRYNSTLGETEYYDGILWRSISDSNPEATGGTIVDTEIGGVPYRIHLFTNTGNSTFTVTKGGEVEYLIVAGGGGGAGGWAGDEAGSGGGAGEVLYGSTTISAQTYLITVGSGGNGGGPNQDGQDGGNSSAFGLTANGGFGANKGNGQPGGAYGGPGNDGGAYSIDDGGGGGGAGSPGEDATSDQNPGKGGQGVLIGITGTNSFYAAGGGGGHGGDDGPALSSNIGGLGGGGRGGDGWDEISATSGFPNTGGGGGGGQGTTDVDPQAGDGGSGIVIVRYPKNSATDTAADRTVVATQPYRIAQAGLHYYNIENAGSGEILYYKLPQPFDLDNRQFMSVLNIGERVDVFDISNDGTRFWALGDNGATSNIREFSLQTAFDLATATLVDSIPYPFDPDPPICFEFADNGKKWYIENAGQLIQYDLSTPYDIRSRTQTGTIGGFPTSGAGDPAFSPDGSRLTIGLRSGTTIRSGSCSTPFDISTYREEATFTTSNGDPSCAKWNEDGTRLYVRHASPDMVNEYATTTPYSVAGMSFVRQVFNNPGFAGGGHEFNYTY
jgi:hypothetical protein